MPATGYIRGTAVAGVILTVALFLLNTTSKDPRGTPDLAPSAAGSAAGGSASTSSAPLEAPLWELPAEGPLNSTSTTGSPADPAAPVGSPDTGLPETPTNEKAFTIPHHKVRLRGIGCEAFRALRDGSLRSTQLPPDVKLTLIQENGGNEQPFQLDYLVTYVNPFALAKRPREGAPSAQRIRDWNELYWLLRSIFLNGRLCVANVSGTPSNCLLRTIHIFANGADHVPDWLACRLTPTNATDEEGLFQQFLSSKVKVTAHSDVFPGNHLTYDMSFNSNVIELNMHRIQGLSSLYLEFNNDFFLGRPLRFQDIFTPVVGTTKQTSESYCDVIPITFLKARLYKTDRVIRSEVAEADDPDFSDLKRQSKMFFYFKKFNNNLLLAISELPFAKNGAVRRSDGTTKQMVLLQYAHTPTFFDKRSLLWMLRLPVLQRYIKATLDRWNRRSVDDVWVPYLYINTRFLARRCQRCGYFVDATRDVTPPIYTFVEYRDAAGIQKTTKSLPTKLSRRPGFVTMNDDVSDDIPALVADPSKLLFTSIREAAEVPGENNAANAGPRCPRLVSCEPEFVDKRLQKLKRFVSGENAKNPKALQAVRYLLLLHQFYCKQLNKAAPMDADPTPTPEPTVPMASSFEGLIGSTTNTTSTTGEALG